MREALVSILLLVAAASSSDLGKDVNYYKDYLRARSDELPEGPAIADRLYFYRTPLQLYPGLLPVLEEEFRKRTGNVFKKLTTQEKDCSDDYHTRTSAYLFPAVKFGPSSSYTLNHMLNKDSWEAEGMVPQKRSSKAALSAMLQGKHPYHTDEGHYCPYGK